MVLNAKLRKGLTLGMVGLISNLKQNKRAKTSNTYASFEKNNYTKIFIEHSGSPWQITIVKSSSEAFVYFYVKGFWYQSKAKLTHKIDALILVRQTILREKEAVK